MRTSVTFPATSGGHFGIQGSHGIVDCSLSIRGIALEEDYIQKRMDMVVYTHVELNYLETVPKTFLVPARQNIHSGKHS